ncbi:hypothetical protein [Aequorivita lipolytica]|uniref:Glutaminyl-tRNA synthetase n=1 Tax=Aequorivita lipolytica TaxID=153267 RepID=A0A5C6YSE0_9FLAO|nr:hypothetical protein [Aequorivita lipolytica]TXD70257.1 hypothetical protein ESV24_03585 [Aequorivita lipolytica]SRX50682.1 hypothetical protein AEQU2_01158 [Aequorivita lipolytica]
MKKYTTFEEIDRDLKYLRLKAQIDLEEVKLGLNEGRNTISEVFSPINLVANTIGSILKKAFVYKMVDKLIGIKKVKNEDYES